MSSPEMNRRDFSRLTAAAFGGVVAGSIAGCAGDAPSEPAAAPAGAAPAGAEGSGAMPPEGSGAASATDGEAAHNVAFLMEEPHVCRGLNACKGNGAGGENACAGQGACATAAAHDCHTENECKGQGGCGEHAGQNACKGQGECSVPLSDATWKKARAAFEGAMKAAEKEVGAAPAKA